MSLDYRKLQNGSDIRGISMDGVEGENPNLGKEETFRLTRGFVMWLSDKIRKEPEELTISVGTDSRITKDFLKEAVIETLIHIGVKVLDAGMASTPAMFMSTLFEEYKCDGAIMITASHLPFNRNGFKYFDKTGGLNKEDITEIISYAQSEIVIENIRMTDTYDTNPPEKIDLIETYCDYLMAKIALDVNHPKHPEKPLKGLKIVVDAGNGAGGFYATRILKPLGADITGSQFLEPDGRFPNHIPNPEDKDAMKSISDAVIKNKADLGLIFDTDVDRISAVDSSGKEISRNKIVAMAAALIAQDYPGTTVVTDSITSDQLTEYLEKCLGLKHLRFKRGYKNVINKSIELNENGIDSQLAIETSGHAAYKENFFLDDGAYLATKIVIKLAKLHMAGEKIDVILSSLEEPLESTEVRLKIEGNDFSSYADSVLEGFRFWAMDRENKGIEVVEPNYEGIRLNINLPEVEGWCLLRKSLHDPILPLNIEVNKGKCETILSMVLAHLSNYQKIRIK